MNEYTKTLLRIMHQSSPGGGLLRAAMALGGVGLFDQKDVSMEELPFILTQLYPTWTTEAQKVALDVVKDVLLLINESRPQQPFAKTQYWGTE